MRSRSPPRRRQTFETNCAACHGPGGAGGDRAPALNDNPDLRKLSAADIENIIRQGTAGGMPAFSSLPASDVAGLAGWIHSMNLSALRPCAAATEWRRARHFSSAKAAASSCHMVHGRGAVNGPDLTNIAARSTLAEMEKVLDDPTSQMGVHSLAVCPPWAFCPDFSWAVRGRDACKRRHPAPRLRRASARSMSCSFRSFDGKLHLLDAGEYTLVRQEKASSMPPLKATPAQRRDLLAYLSSLGGIEAGPVSGPAPPVITGRHAMQCMKPRRGEWPTYNGLLNGNRYSSLDQVNTSNVQQLQPQFIFSPGGTGLEVTPCRGGRRDVRDRRRRKPAPSTHAPAVPYGARRAPMGSDQACPAIRKARQDAARRGLIVEWRCWETASFMYRTMRSSSA